MKRFIELGWYTVPLKGKIERLPDGKKTLPQFPKNYREIYSKKFNTEITGTAAALTEPSGIIALDCDNDYTFKLFSQLDKDYKFIFKSVGKSEGGGTIVYKISEPIDSFKIHSEYLKLDIISKNGMIYLPTVNNKTKEFPEKMPKLKEIPEDILALVKELYKLKGSYEQAETKINTYGISKFHLAPMLEEFLAKNDFYKQLFRIITPKSFRNLPQYLDKGFLHPSEVPEGRGSEYLSKISAILGADESVDEVLYLKTMEKINSLFDVPMDSTRLQNTIINPMLQKKVRINGKVVWTYNKDWKNNSFGFVSILGDFCEVFYDDIKNSHFLVNYTADYIKEFKDIGQLIHTLQSMMNKMIKKDFYITRKKIYRTFLSPFQEFGVQDGFKFNIFKPTEAMRIFNEPEIWADNYVVPTNILNLVKYLANDQAEYLLRFLKTKFMTFKYSPVILYFMGAQGSGKDVFVKILGKLIGEQYIAKPDTKVFLEQYNYWLVDKFFIQLDEYGDKLIKKAEKNEVLGKLKSYTGSQYIQVRQMRADGFNYEHRITFILTANSNPLPLDIGERRLAYFKSPEPLQAYEPNPIEFVDNCFREINDFAYFLATEVEPLPENDYMKAPEGEDKKLLILDSLPASEKIAYCLAEKLFEELDIFVQDYECYNFWEDHKIGKLWMDNILELYYKMTDNFGTAQQMYVALRKYGFDKYHTTKNGKTKYFIRVKGIKEFKPKDLGFIEEEDIL